MIDQLGILFPLTTDGTRGTVETNRVIWADAVRPVPYDANLVGIEVFEPPKMSMSMAAVLGLPQAYAPGPFGH